MNTNITDTELIVTSIAESKSIDLDEDNDLITILFATEIDESKIKKKKD